MRHTLSVAMIAMNEEAPARTLESVRGRRNHPRRLRLTRPHPGNSPVLRRKNQLPRLRCHGEQKNVALDLCTSDWILLLDATKSSPRTPGRDPCPARLPESSPDARPPQFNAYLIPRLNLYFGRWIRHGGFYPDLKLRLFRRAQPVSVKAFGPHSTPQFAGPRGRLRGDMLHYAYPTLDLYLEHMSATAQRSPSSSPPVAGTSRSWPAFLWNTIANPAATFLYNYFVRLGFLDGREASSSTSTTPSTSTGSSSKPGKLAKKRNRKIICHRKPALIKKTAVILIDPT